MNKYLIFGWMLMLSNYVFSQTTIEVDIEKQYELGQQALNNFQYQKAADHFYECHRMDYDNKNYLQKLAFSYLKLGNYSEAKFSYNSLLKKDSTDVNAWSNLGSIYEKELNYSKASDCYMQLLKIDSTNSFYFRQNALMALRMKNPIKALTFLNEAHRLNERDLVVINQFASLLLQIKQPEAAEKIVNKGLVFSPDNFRLLYTKADILHHQKDYKPLVKTIDHAMSLGDTLQFYQKIIGSAYLQLENFDSCIYHLSRVVERNEATDITFYQLALAYRGKGDLKASEAAYQAAIDKAISENVGMYFKNLALVLDEQKKYKAAISAWKKAIEYSPKQSAYYFHLAEDCDKYYRDKKIARRYYQKYYDSKHPDYRAYVRKKIQYLNGHIHQQVKQQ